MQDFPLDGSNIIFSCLIIDASSLFICLLLGYYHFYGCFYEPLTAAQQLSFVPH